MARHFILSGNAVKRAASPLVLSIGVSLAMIMGGAIAAQPGHGRVSSAPGAPLEVSIPLRGLTSDDLKVLKASVADAAAWAQAGLTLPAAIDSLSVTIEPGLEPSSRTVVLKSTQAVNRPVIDVLIRLSTASGARSIQSSYLVLVQDASAGAASSLRVARGDTLYAIALTKSVPNADIYQVMWAIYEANKNAFISDNMNLLRAGATLNIPDAAAIRAVDAKYARAMFVKHDQAFRSRRGAGQTSAAVPVVATVSTQSGSVTAPVSAPSAVVATGDQVKLDSRSPADQMADALVASANELRETQSRVQALQKNVEELKDALQKSQAAAESLRATRAATVSGSPGAEGATGAPGSPGTSGSPGTPGAPGAMGAMGAPGAPGAPGATGATGAQGTPGPVGTSGSAGGGTATASDPARVGQSGASGASGVSGVSGTSSSAAAVSTNVDVKSAVTPSAVTPGSAEASPTTPAANSALKDPVAKNPGEAKTALAKVKEYASDHLLGLVLGVSALLALLIAFLLKRAGKNARIDESDQEPRDHPGLASDFDQKLQSIDLNLSDDQKPELNSGSTKTGV